MPPRIPQAVCLRAQLAFSSGRSVPVLNLPIRLFSSSPAAQSQKRRHQDPYLIAQAKARRAANISRQQALQIERAASLGDPVRGITTPLVKSFQTGLPVSEEDTKEYDSEYTGKIDQTKYLKHSLTRDVLEKQLTESKWLTTPVPKGDMKDPGKMSAEEIEEASARQEENSRHHMKKATAIERIVALESGNSRDIMRVNIKRCVETFGRHNTDKILPSKPKSAQPGALGDASPVPKADPNAPMAEASPIVRAGPDTGSSEVQIAILTAKINRLVQFLETRGPKDKMNKRNLRLLVHKRQKHLKYLRRRERGGPRWQRCIELLGLTEGTWRGEISL
ncbi:hypothetical protein EJ06DRAFT_56413 [Trichodelitschia bisporula]|uniref:Ribosomal protein S15 n=1 Tax=Trichodelitschia bisporula TaxID=703511 RepID=A0A6G1HUK4_9PEZI|nr:hypothetical protein EJ06DRAFT_56413 [Trichodelitschia bisporula]